MPFWLMSLGNSLLREGYPTETISVPWDRLPLYLVLFSVPCLLGIVLGCFGPPKLNRLFALLFRPGGILLSIGAAIVVVYDLSWFVSQLVYLSLSLLQMFVTGFCSILIISNGLVNRCSGRGLLIANSTLADFCVSKAQWIIG